jgi:hypothetical protein
MELSSIYDVLNINLIIALLIPFICVQNCIREISAFYRQHIAAYGHSERASVTLVSFDAFHSFVNLHSLAYKFIAIRTTILPYSSLVFTANDQSSSFFGASHV